jgi:hypothetical protein
MRYARKASGAIGALILISGCAVSAQSPAPNPFIGLWKLNIERSRLPGTPPPNYAAFRRYEDHGEGWMYHTIVFSWASGANFNFTAARYDRKDYPVYASSTDIGNFLSAGIRPPVTVAFKITDPHTLEYTDKTNGKITGTGVSTVSSDGKVLTETARKLDGQGKETSTAVAVYEKQ